MKIFKRIILVLLVLLVLAQIPFIYRRYETGKLAEKIAQFDTQRTTYTDPNFKEYKGIIHAHTNLGGHSTGSFDELIAAANTNDLDFVLMTEHYSDTFDTAAQTLNGVYGKTLFVGGNEIDTSDGDRFLLIPGGGEAANARMSGTTAFLEAAHRENKLAMITYPEKFKSWDSQFDGIEVFSLHTQAKQMSWLAAFGDLIWSYPSYPELTLAKNFTRPDANLAKFDEIATQRKISLFAGTDAHSNIGFHLFGDDAGNKLINIKVDPYATIFRIARIHVLIEKDKEFNRGTLLEAIRSGSYWIGFDALGDTTGFRFQLDEASVGGVLPWREYPHLILNVPPRTNVPEYRLGVPSEMSVRVYRNGEIFPLDIVAGIYSKQRFEPGVYRVEVYRDDLGPPFDKIPWIISNPIYVR
ncbi:MAG TPA: hypothetical protein VMZ26_00150 [Pyrinomonadaceae bacterium]|nr:hypothetical protein [Pyrinomonadaceae bacterium]